MLEIWAPVGWEVEQINFPLPGQFYLEGDEVRLCYGQEQEQIRPIVKSNLALQNSNQPGVLFFLDRTEFCWTHDDRSAAPLIPKIWHGAINLERLMTKGVRGYFRDSCKGWDSYFTRKLVAIHKIVTSFDVEHVKFECEDGKVYDYFRPLEQLSHVEHYPTPVGFKAKDYRKPMSGEAYTLDGETPSNEPLLPGTKALILE